MELCTWPTEPTPTEDKEDMDNVAIFKTFDVLPKDPSAPVPKETASIFSQMDPHAILTIKSQTNKAVHITQFLTKKKANAAVRAGGRNFV